MPRARVLVLVLGALLAAGGVAYAVTSKTTGRIGPRSRIQPSGRRLRPYGKLTQKLGNFPAGGAPTTNGRFLWTLSAGRGPNDLRIVSLKTRKIVQILPLPGASGGVAMAPDGRTAYVSGTRESEHLDQQTPPDTPGREGDVIGVLHYDPQTGIATRDGTIAVPPPATAPAVQNFPPKLTTRLAWPREIAVSPDGSKLLVALNLADTAAVVDTATRAVRYVSVKGYPYGAAILSDGKTGLVSNEADGLVSVIDLDDARVIKTIGVGPPLSHPEAIAVDPKADRAYVAMANQDVVVVLDTKRLAVQRTLSVGRPQGLGTSPTALSVTRDGRRLLVADSGEDAIAVFNLPQAGAQTALAAARRRRRPEAFELLGRVPVAAYPVGAWATNRGRNLVWLSGKGLGVGPNPTGPIPTDPRDNDNQIGSFAYLPRILRGVAGVGRFPSAARLRRLSPRATRQLRPVNAQKAPPGSPIAAGASKIRHVFYVVKENRSYDQILGDEAKGDGDPKLTLFGRADTPNQHALAERFGLLDHVYANSEASIDGHFWTSAGAVSDYVTKNWMANYAARGRPYDFGVYAVTWPAAGFLFDQASKQGLSWFNFGEAIAGVIPLPDRNRTTADSRRVLAKFTNSDIGIAPGCFPNDASIGTDAVAAVAGLRIETYDASLPAGAPLGSMSRVDCFAQRFKGWLLTNSVPSFTYLTLPSDHTNGTTPKERSPRAMIADNDLAVGQLVGLISHSKVWKDSLILVVEDDSQDGPDHVDAHRIPALAISPYSRRGAVVHTRYDFLSFIRTLENAIGMRPLTLFDAAAVPLYDALSGTPANPEPYDPITPARSLVERNGPGAPGARESHELNIGRNVDAVPQQTIDRLLWQAVHGPGSQPPPPGPNAANDRG